MSGNKPVLHLFKEKIAASVAAATNGKLTEQQVLECLEDCKAAGYDFSLPMMKLRRYKIAEDPKVLAEEWKSNLKTNEWVSAAEVHTQEGKTPMHYLNMAVTKTTFFQHALGTVFDKQGGYGETDDYAGKTVCVEFSSPNIAKPFHAGHLRSTIMGNFLKNLYKTLGAKVHAINYLGDWGTQYGLLALGFKKYGNEEELTKDPIKHLFHVYVAINKDADADPAVKEEARGYFKRMEDGDEEVLSLWQRFRGLSIEEYKKMYKRLNVEFDVYSGESQMSEGMKEAVARMEEKKLLTTDEKGGEIVDLSKFKLGTAVIKKKDGATLYITRDLAAAKARHDEYKFDKSIYVVAAQQDLHFKQLFKMLEMMGYEWSNKCVHVNFGMVNGMKTRKGQVVFLEEILNEAKAVMLEKMQENKMGKLEEVENPELTADIVGLSAVVVQDLSAKRIKDYDFSWDRMTAKEGNTGPYLQYAHARLCSMDDKTASVPVTKDIDTSLLTEKEAYDLVYQIAKYPLVLQTCSQNMEPSTLVTYMFDLCGAISSAHLKLKVKDQEINLAKARKLVFWAARTTLGNALTMLGLVPLTRM
eukprot:TRINITY_DN10202_c0_g1_i1.p1 TRINITY_DN10202_c0_g1~~TRINITY_DN10202_c0_g1_i1.p1  ORF type:complete len:623 (+),score=184.26 TRINITY_DN10202_c0_g1_i1:119-1870(+)